MPTSAKTTLQAHTTFRRLVFTTVNRAVDGAFIVIFIFITAVTGGDDGPRGKMAAGV